MRKNKKRIDPRYFLSETTHKNEGLEDEQARAVEWEKGYDDGLRNDKEYDEALGKVSDAYREGYREGQEQAEREEHYADEVAFDWLMESP